MISIWHLVLQLYSEKTDYDIRANSDYINAV